MKTIAVHIKEADKGERELSLLNLRDEIVGFLYRDTVASSTRADMQFYVLLYFCSIPIGKVSFLEVILEEGIPRFDTLNQAFRQKRGYLRANEYREMVEQYGLTDLFYKDLFFVICEGIMNLGTIKTQFADFLAEDETLSAVFKRLETKYKPRLEASFEMFKSSRIEDSRIDDNGNYHDLSKSVYRTVRMRSSRNLELNLQKYTEIKKIESNSPIDFTFIQQIDPEIIFDLWTKYHVADYMVAYLKGAWNFANQPLPATAIAGLLIKYAHFKKTNGNEDRKGKRLAKEELDQSKKEHKDYLERLNLRLVDSVLLANERLNQEIKELKRERFEQADKLAALRDEETIKKLTERIERLENLQIKTEVVEVDEPQASLFN